MAIASDWTINYTAKTITHTSGSTVYDVFSEDGDTESFYWWLQDTFDELDNMDDPVPIKKNSPTSFDLINGWTFGAPTTDINFLKGAAITDTADDTVWSSIYTIGSDSVISSVTLYVVQNGAVLLTAGSAGHIDILVKTKNAGTLIDSGKITVFAREWGYTYDHYEMDMSGGGRQPAPIAISTDANNASSTGTVSGYTNMGLTFGTYTADVNNDGTDENYEAQVDLNNEYTVAQAYEWLKYVTRRGATDTVDGVQGQLYTRADATYAEVKAAPLGTFAGGKFFGAQGVYLYQRPASEANKYELIDSDGTGQIKEPVSISVQVTGLDASDRVLVALASGGAIVTDQYTTAASGNSASSSTVTLSAEPAADTPSSGTLRLGAGRKRYPYSSRSGAVFTLDSVTLAEDQNSADAFVPWLDKVAGATSASASVAYAADRSVLIRVRQKGIVPFESPGTITSTGLSVSAIRTEDPVVT